MTSLYIKASNSLYQTENLGLSERVCDICGKKFEARQEYVYKQEKGEKRTTVYYCSYSCFRKKDAEHNIHYTVFGKKNGEKILLADFRRKQAAERFISKKYTDPEDRSFFFMPNEMYIEKSD